VEVTGRGWNGVGVAVALAGAPMISGLEAASPGRLAGACINPGIPQDASKMAAMVMEISLLMSFIVTNTTFLFVMNSVSERECKYVRPSSETELLNAC
jgi:hypothetical protein